MSSERWARVSAVYEAVLDAPPDQRSARLALLTAGDDELRKEVEQLMLAERVDGPLDRSVFIADPLRTSTQALAPDTLIGPYRIEHAVGAGGMGEVYAARDTKLGRRVALKVLPTQFVSDRDRLARFRREAQLLATLHHPNIAGIYGLEESDGIQALALEYVDGPTLADRLVDGALPVDDALAIARQIAEALEAAHEQGIIHRDLKPANIKITVDGVVKVLDFGLAKLADAAATGGQAGTSVTQSPTITTPAMTAAGMILGTAAYMSPEQAKGRPADKRSDVWAFGCVLYEMLTGKRAFAGEDVADTLANVLKTEPDWSALPTDTPAGLRTLLHSCLAKDKRQRLGDIAGALFVIRESPALSALSTTAQTHPIAPPMKPLWRRAVPIAVTATVVAALAIIADRAVRQPASPPAQVSRFSLRLPEGQRFPSGGGQVVAISPDGSHIAYVANGRIYLRSLSDLETRPIPGTETPTIADITFSADGQSIFFVAANGTGSGMLSFKRVPLAGGTALTIHDMSAVGYFGGLRWAPVGPGGLLFVQAGKGILRIPENGGAEELLVSIKDDLPSGPQFLPAGEAVLFTLAKGITAPMGAASDIWDKAEIVVQDLKTGQRAKVWEGGDAVYVPTGHLVYAIGGTLFAVPFDAAQRKVTGSAVPMVEGVGRPVMSGAAPGVAYFAVARTGSLVYIPGPRTSSSNRLDLGFSDRQGQVQPLNLTPSAYQFPRVSPDGKYVAVGTDDGKEAQVWVHDLSGRSATRQLTIEGRNRFPVWSGDSQEIAFQSDREKDPAIFVQRADGSTRAERVTKPAPGVAHVPQSWSPDGRTLLFSEVKGDQFSLWAVSMTDRKISRVGDIHSTLDPLTATFSPDGRWIAYLSNEGTRRTIFMQSFPPSDRKYLIATNAWHPLWSPDGQSLFYRLAGERQMMVSVKTAPTVTLGNPRQIPIGGWRVRGRLEREYDITRDGRFIGAIAADTESADTPQQINVVLNWTEELKAKAPVR